MRRFITFCIVLLAAALVGYVAWSSRDARTIDDTDRPNDFATTTEAKTDEKLGIGRSVDFATTTLGGFKLELRYPDATATTVAEVIHAEVVALASTTTADYAASFTKCRAAGGSPTAAACMDIGPNPWSMTIDYDIHESERAVSYDFELYGYYGGAHGSTSHLGLTFDRVTGERLKLSDFVDEMDEKAFIAALDRRIRAFYAKSDVEELDFELATPGSAEFDRRYGSSFFVTSEGVGIGFSSYELGYFALGSPSIVVPYSDF